MLTMPKPDLALDHLVITCRHLDDGIRYIEQMFDVLIPAGGQHLFMGTHNAVMAIGDGIYLEVIAIDPDLPQPARPRWFGLDTMGDDQPKLAHFVLRTTDMDATLDDLPGDQAEMIGPAMAASRGNLNWRVTLNPTGLPPEGGCLPALIEWDGTPPQYSMTFPGPELGKLTLCHPQPESFRENLIRLGAGALLNGDILDIALSDQPRLKTKFSNAGQSTTIE